MEGFFFFFSGFESHIVVTVFIVFFVFKLIH
jgi:hypothetical protein